MNFEVGKKYEGFELVQDKFIPEINSKARIFEHKKTGARLLSLENDDENKVFSISFKTIPEDDTGVAHILEHCVLQGSRKYPSKNTFAELGKGAYSTYLNALTYPDMTTFPVSTINEQELFNMMDVYMDAVFYPNIYKDSNTFKREGWRYEVDENGKLSYNGVVFNEMNALTRDWEVQKILFKDTNYQYDSAGNPEKIPDLTYEKFLEFHKKYYHPSNSYMYLYGNGDIQKQLKFLDNEYLRHFDKKEIDTGIKEPKPLEEIKTVEYEYQADESVDKNTREVSLNWLIDENVDIEFIHATSIIRTLISKENTILHKNIVENDICKALSMTSFANGFNKPKLIIKGKNCNIKNLEKFKDVLFESLNQIVAEGIDKKEVTEVIKQSRFGIKMPSTENGINFGAGIMLNWIQGKNPIEMMNDEEVLEKIENNLDNGYFEKRLKRWLIDNKNCVFAIEKPNSQLLNEKQQRIEKKLESIQSDLTEKYKITEESKKFKEYQSIPDTQEDINKIPRISLIDIPRQAVDYKLVEDQIGNEKVLFYPSNIKDMVYTNLLFDLKHVEQKLLPYIPLMRGLLNMKLSTENNPYKKLEKLMNQNSRAVGFSVQLYSDYKDKDIYYPKFTAETMALKSEFKESFKILNDIMNNTIFHKDIDRIKRFVSNQKKDFKDNKHSNPLKLASNYLELNYNEVSKYINELNGIEYYKMLCKMEKDLEKNPEKAIEKLNKVKGKLFNKQNLLINIITDKDTYSDVKQNLGIILENLSDDKHEEKKYKFEKPIKKLGIIIPSNTNYVVQGYDFKKLGYENNGKNDVFKQVLNNYLHNEIRGKNGAYGCWSELNNNCLTMVSYRDPHIKETLNTYKNAGEDLKNIRISPKELESYKIAALKGYDYPKTIFKENDIGLTRYIGRSKFEDRQKQRDGIFSTTVEDVRKLPELVEAITKQNCYCVVGNEKQIKEQCKKDKFLFNKVIDDITKDDLSMEREV